jgi:hypothetical protein
MILRSTLVSYLSTNSMTTVTRSIPEVGFCCITGMPHQSGTLCWYCLMAMRQHSGCELKQLHRFKCRWCLKISFSYDEDYSGNGLNNCTHPRIGAGGYNTTSHQWQKFEACHRCQVNKESGHHQAPCREHFWRNHSCVNCAKTANVDNTTHCEHKWM